MEGGFPTMRPADVESSPPLHPPGKHSGRGQVPAQSVRQWNEGRTHSLRGGRGADRFADREGS